MKANLFMTFIIPMCCFVLLARMIWKLCRFQNAFCSCTCFTGIFLLLHMLHMDFPHCCIYFTGIFMMLHCYTDCKTWYFCDNCGFFSLRVNLFTSCLSLESSLGRLNQQLFQVIRIFFIVGLSSSYSRI